MTLLYWEWHLIPRQLLTSIDHRSVSRAASKRLGILRKSWQVFHDRLLLGRCFRGFVLPVLEYCSAFWSSAADIHLTLLDRVVSGASFLTGGAFECDLAHRRSVAVLWMLYKIRCNPIHRLCGALPVAYVPVRGTRGAVIAHQFTYAPPRCIAGLLFPCQYLCGTILVTPCSMVWDWRVSRAGPMPFYWPRCSLTFCLLLFSLSLLSFYGLVLWGWGLRTHRVLIALSQPFIQPFFNNNNNNNVRYIVSIVSKRICILRLVKCVFVETSITLLLSCIYYSNPRLSFYGAGVSCWLLLSASRTPGVFGGQVLFRSELLFIVS